jgi:hypothetical protein
MPTRKLKKSKDEEPLKRTLEAKPPKSLMSPSRISALIAEEV